MALTEKMESTVDAGIVDRDANRHEGPHAGSGRRFSGPVLSDTREPTAVRGHTGFASVGGWVVSR